MASSQGYRYSSDFQFQAFSGYSENNFLADGHEHYMGHASANNKPCYPNHAMATKKNQYSSRNQIQSYGYNRSQFQAHTGEALTHGSQTAYGPPDHRLTGQAHYSKSNHAIAENQVHNYGRNHGHPATNYQASYVKSSYQRTENYRDKSCSNMEYYSESEYESENDSESETECESEDEYECHGPPCRRF